MIIRKMSLSSEESPRLRVSYGIQPALMQLFL